MNTELRKGIFALVCLSVVYSCMGIFVRGLGSDFAVFQQVYLRVFSAFLLALIIFWQSIQFKKVLHITYADWFVIGIRAVAFSVGVVFFTLAFLSEGTSYSNATFVQTIPLLPVLGYIFLRERLTIQQTTWIFVGFIGVGLISITDVHQLIHWGKGEMFALLCAIAFDISYVAQKLQSDYLTNRENVVLIFFIEGIVVFAASFFFNETLVSMTQILKPSILFNIGLSAVFNVCNLLLINYGFKRVPVSIGGNILILETFFALLISIFFYQEFPVMREIIGGLLIVLSVYGINRIANQE